MNVRRRPLMPFARSSGREREGGGWCDGPAFCEGRVEILAWDLITASGREAGPAKALSIESEADSCRREPEEDAKGRVIRLLRTSTCGMFDKEACMMFLRWWTAL